ncbi:MAG: 50S ribosomal protein L22 [Bacteroidota bacterium]
MEARAVNRFVGTSPMKMRLVIDLIRGRGVEEALSILHFSPKHASNSAEKVLRSAISNLQNKDQSGRIDPSHVFVKEAFVNGGPVAKRVMPAPMGRAFRIRKRSHHLTIVVAQRQQKVQAAAKPKAAESAPKSAAAPGVKPKKSGTKSKASTSTKKATKES